jgi:hypothetical protein
VILLKLALLLVMKVVNWTLSESFWPPFSVIILLSHCLSSGATGEGNPVGGLVFSNGVQMHEWFNFSEFKYLTESKLMLMISVQCLRTTSASELALMDQGRRACADM